MGGCVYRLLLLLRLQAAAAAFTGCPLWKPCAGHLLVLVLQHEGVCSHTKSRTKVGVLVW